MAADLTRCKAKNHYLKIILEVSDPPGLSSTVVRWCEVCGAVVVDTDYDDRTNPGAVMKMRVPSYLHGVT